MDFSAKAAEQVYQQADCLYTSKQVESAITSMARGINQALSGKNPILVCVMNGGVVVFGKLLVEINFPCEVDFVHVTRYQNNVGGPEVKWLAGPSIDPKGRFVLLVDDILDEGITLRSIEDEYYRRGAQEVSKAVLVAKDRDRSEDISVDFTGLSVPDRYVFGYGMDYKGYLRHVSGIYAERE